MANASLYLINTLFDLYILVLVIRLLLAYASANYFNPITQVIIQLTQPLVKPLRTALPNFRGIEFSTLILIIFFEMIKILLLNLFIAGMPNLFFVLTLAVLAAIKLILHTLFYAILLQAILSWFQTGYSPLGQILEQITSPLLTPLRRLLPPLHGIDISPIPALIILSMLNIILA